MQELNKKLTAIFSAELKNAFELRENLINHMDIDKDVVEQRKSQFNTETARILGKMQRKLEKISQEVDPSK